MSDQKLPESRPPQPMQTFTDEQKQLILNTVAKGATPDEFKLFLYRCANLRLDPMKPGQAHFVKWGNNPGTFVVGIDGFRAIAGRTGLHCGTARDVIYDEKGKLIGAWAEVDRKDWKRPAREVVTLAEYSTGKSMWAKMPATMLKKVAEAAALRMAFPDDLGGVYESAEMDQAAPREVHEPKVAVASPEPPFDPPSAPATKVVKKLQVDPEPRATSIGEQIKAGAERRGLSMDVLSEYRRRVLKVPDGTRPTDQQLKQMLDLVTDEATDLKLIQYLIETADGGEPTQPPF